jgi:signal transduction histidine kinase
MIICRPHRILGHYLIGGMEFDCMNLLIFIQLQEITIFRIIQEALANIGKHAEANQVLIELTAEERSAVFSIKDNGKGFSPLAPKRKNPLESGLGLTAMAERAQMAGGTFTIESAVGKGTLKNFSVPIRRKRATPPTAN